MEIHTIGFTKRTAAGFFGALEAARVTALVDTRLNNTSQLAAFAKRDDLAYFLDRLLSVPYVTEPLLAPEESMLRAYREKSVTWDDYASGYNALLDERGVRDALDRSRWGDRPVLLCSEHAPDHCHRRLAAEHLAGPGDRIVHL